jgi:hypothetical protein
MMASLRINFSCTITQKPHCLSIGSEFQSGNHYKPSPLSYDNPEHSSTTAYLPLGMRIRGAVSFQCNFMTKMIVFRDVVSCSLVEVYRRFRCAHCLHHQGTQCPVFRLHGATTQKTVIFILCILAFRLRY